MPSDTTPCTPSSLKRPFSESITPPSPATKKQKVQYHRVHQLQLPLSIGPLESTVIADDQSVDQILSSVIGNSLRDAGFDYAEPLALDSFRDDVEEYVLRFLSYTRASMSACRRTQPIPQDFEHALDRHNISVDTLRPYLKTCRKVKRTPNVLPSPPPEDVSQPTRLPFLGSELNGLEDSPQYSFIPKHFPKLPSRHTFQNTPVFTKRETDPRKIREQATEEGRLGEEALRKITRAAAKESRQKVPREEDLQPWGRQMESMESMFEKTLAATLKRQAEEEQKRRKGKEKFQGDPMDLTIDFGTEESTGPDVREPPVTDLAQLELGPVINCERRYWRRKSAAEVRKPKPQIQNHTTK